MDKKNKTRYTNNIYDGIEEDGNDLYIEIEPGTIDPKVIEKINKNNG